MSARRGLVLDANILIRAVFGQRVQQLLETYEEQSEFYAPDVCFEDAQKHVPAICSRRGLDAELYLPLMHTLERHRSSSRP